MKKILSTALLFAGFLGMTSCDSFLDEEPKSAITGVSYYKTGDQIIANVNSMYRTGAPNFMANMTGAYRGSSLSAQEMLVGYFMNDFEGQEVDFAFARNLTRQENTHLTCTNQSNNTWKDAYIIINRANGVLKYIDEIEMNDKAQYKGEAQFYRALNYFYLVKFFGGVPLLTEPTEGMDNLFVSRDTEENVINLVISDLEGAVTNLPATTFAANNHRVTKYAAEMVLADVYMRVGKYDKAATLLKDVVNNSGHSLTENDDLAANSAFNILRENDDLPEVIWAYEYDGNISKNGNFPTHAFDGDAEQIFDNSYTLWVKTFGVNDRFLNVYQANDLRIQPNQFFHWTYTNPKNGKTWTSKNGACNWYWYEEEAILETLSGKKDWNFYRYAEALLSAAESIAQSEGVTAEAAKYLSMVQARANMEGKTAAAIATELQGLTKDAFIEACWTERLREMPLEMKMWDLCVRTGKFPNISETTKGQVTYETLIGAKNGSGATFKATDMYWPIPIDEIQRNPNLTQNDGYAAQ